MEQKKYQPYLKFAAFCKVADEDKNGDLNLEGVIDLIEIDEPDATISDGSLLTTLSVNLAFCIADAEPGQHHLMIGIKAPGLPLEPPVPQKIVWENDIIFQRWIKVMQIPIQRVGLHVAAILFDGMPIGEASFLVRYKQ
tara:strand:+ start:3426 stop:3842 length:417 start_codon:yes stop_codon:yes gene_type:complete